MAIHRFSNGTEWKFVRRFAKAMANKKGETVRVFREMPGGKPGAFIAAHASEDRPAGTYLEAVEPDRPFPDAKDKAALKYAGLMGHQYVICVDDRDGGRRTSVQCNTADEARRFKPDQKENPRVYHKTEKGWKFVNI